MLAKGFWLVSKNTIINIYYQVIDFQRWILAGDTVNLPTAGMREAMYQVEVGDNNMDVFSWLKKAYSELVAVHERKRSWSQREPV